MEKLNQDTDGSSLDIVQDNIDKLKTLFPDVFSEGKIDFDKLQQALGENLETQDERYNFTWHGKAQAKRIAQTVSTGTLRPCKEESKNWDNAQNLFIEGDNLEVLKLLQKSYHNQVKMIYIDPPYNTGKEFIYPDNYRDNLDTYMQYTGQKDDEGHKFGTNTDTSGRYHTNWLNMMYPRLKLARNLLRDDGVIFISIDDNEQANLKKLCDEIFGEENFISNVIWHKRYAASNDAKGIPAMHDHILVYQKSNKFNRLLLPRTDKQDSLYKYDSNDGKGRWRSDNLTVKTVSEAYLYEITNPKTGEKFLPTQGRCWLTSETKMEEWITKGRVFFGQKGIGAPQLKRYLNEVQQGVIPNSYWSYEDVGHTDSSRKELKKLFETSAPIDNPKPTGLLKRIFQISIESDALILDFFSGSCTTAHALMDFNTQNNGSSKYIMVQLPEPCDKKSEASKAGYKTIADIGKERIRRAGEKVLLENADKEGIENLDIGFKVFKLDSSNIKPWDADVDNLEDTLLDHIENIKEERSEDDVLYEILLKYGLDLTVPIEERSINGKTVYAIGLGALVVCLADDISLEVVEGIGKLKAELQPEVMRVVFKDNGFKDDVVKTNAIQNLKKYGIDDVKSL